VDSVVKTDIESFREFVQKHPELIKDVKNNKLPWKKVYQDWIVLGEEHESWNQYSKTKKMKQTAEKKDSKKTEMTIGDILGALSTIQISDVQKYLSQFSNVMDGIQEILQQLNNQSDRPIQLPENEMNKYPSYKD
jgi:hypothetical protein